MVRAKFERSYNSSMVVEVPVANASGAENTNTNKNRRRKKIQGWKRDRDQRGEEAYFRRTRKRTFKYLKVTMLMGQS